MHLADFNTSQDEIEVYCFVHIPLDKSDGLMWVYDETKKKVFVRWLTDNAKNNSDGNHPNCCFAELWNIPEGAMAVHDEAQQDSI